MSVGSRANQIANGTGYLRPDPRLRHSVLPSRSKPPDRGEPWRDSSGFRKAGVGVTAYRAVLFSSAINLFNRGLQPHLDQIEHAAIRYATGYRCKEAVMGS